MKNDREYILEKYFNSVKDFINDKIDPKQFERLFLEIHDEQNRLSDIEDQNNRKSSFTGYPFDKVSNIFVLVDRYTDMPNKDSHDIDGETLKKLVKSVYEKLET